MTAPAGRAASASRRCGLPPSRLADVRRAARAAGRRPRRRRPDRARCCAGTRTTPARRGSRCGWSAACTGSCWRGAAPELAAYYPTVGGAWSSRAATPVLAFLAGQRRRGAAAARPGAADQRGGPRRRAGRRAAAADRAVAAARAAVGDRRQRRAQPPGRPLPDLPATAGAWGDPASPVVLERGLDRARRCRSTRTCASSSAAAATSARST